MSTVLVSGGAGFIGSHLCEHLLDCGFSVRVIDDFSSGKEENIAHLLDRIQVVRGSITDCESLRAAVAGSDCVVHLAAIVSIARSFDNPEIVHDTNVLGTLMLLKEADKAGVKKFVFASSCAVYGDNSFHLCEEIAPAPLSPYALSKHIGEQYTIMFNKTTDMNSVVLRFFNVFGPRQDASSPYAGVVASFVNRILQGESPIVYGDGEQKRDFIFVTDVVRAIIKTISIDELHTDIINVASGEPRTVNDVAGVIGQISGMQLSLVHTDPRECDIRYSQADIGHLKDVLNFQISVPFQEGIKRTIEWYNQKKRDLKQEAVL